MNKNLKDKISLCISIFGNIKILCDKYFIVNKEKVNYLYDLDCELIAQGDEDLLYANGNFLIFDYDDKIICQSLIANKTLVNEKYYDEYKRKRFIAFEALCDDIFITRDYHDNTTLYDLELNKIDTIKNFNNTNVITINNEIHITYRYLYGRHTSNLIIDKNTFKVIQYDNVKILNGYEAIATENNPSWVKSNQFVRNVETIPYFKYSLGYNGRILSDKSYSDIVKFNSICTEYFLTINHNNDRHKELYGVIDNRGLEILQNKYTKIKYLGNGNFYIEDINEKAIYNSIQGNFIFPFKTIINCTIHTVFPFSIIQDVNNNFYILESCGKLYNYNDIAKNIEIYHCKENNNIIKINYGKDNLGETLSKFTDLRLNVITNINAIRMYKDYTWERL